MIIKNNLMNIFLRVKSTICWINYLFVCEWLEIYQLNIQWFNGFWLSFSKYLASSRTLSVLKSVIVMAMIIVSAAKREMNWHLVAIVMRRNAHTINLYGALGVEKLSYTASTSALGSEIVTFLGKFLFTTTL